VKSEIINKEKENLIENKEQDELFWPD